MGPIQVVVTDANNLVLEVTPTPSTTVILDRGIAGPPGPAGDGDVDGPASSTDNAVARFDGTTGKIIQNSAVVISDAGSITGVSDLTVNNNTTLGSSNTDNVTFNARIASEFTPATNNTYDLGRNSHEWRNLYLSGTANLSGGTANGVAYLNGSKVLTTGSALTFDGSALGIGTASVAGTGTRLDARVTSGEAARFVLSGATSNTVTVMVGKQSSTTEGLQLEYDGATGNSALNSVYTNSSLLFKSGGSEQMRLTSTGLGIGTSSPGFKLDVVGNVGIARIQSTSAGQNAQLNLQSTVATWSIGQNITLTSTGTLEFYNGSTRLQLDSSGNLGLGVTPSAWGSGRRAFQVAGSSANYFTGANANATLFGSNFFYDDGIGDNKYIADGFSNIYLQISGQHRWLTAPSGTAGNAISFTQAMTLDASGNLGVGTTSPNLNTVGTVVHVNNASSGYAALTRYTTGNTGSAATDGLDVGMWSDGDAFFWLRESSNIRFATNSTERARIDSSGNLLVGTTSVNPVNDRTNGVSIRQTGFTFRVSAGNNDWGISTSSGVIAYLYSDSGSATTYAGSIAVNGSTASYNSVSDYRLKNTIAPMTGALAKVALLKPCTYKWNADGSDGEGFIAHELAEVVPQCVTGQKDAVDAEGKPQYQGIDTSFLVATVVAALQELKAEFDAYKASHP